MPAGSSRCGGFSVWRSPPSSMTRVSSRFMANPDGRVFVERLGSGISHLGEIDASRVQSLLGLMADYLHTTVSRDRPIVEGAMPIEFLRSRFAGAIPPMVEGASFSIRLPARSVYTLDQYVDTGIITAAQLDTLSDAVLSRKNILVSGGTGLAKLPWPTPSSTGSPSCQISVPAL